MRNLTGRIICFMNSHLMMKCTQKFRQKLNIKLFANELGIELGSFLLI